MDTKGNPTCVGIILDGNRTWAKNRRLPHLEGHRRGRDRVVECARALLDRGIPHLAVFAFSTENWARKAEEVSYMMGLFRESAKMELRKLSKEGIRLRFVGQRGRFPEDIQDTMRELELETARNIRLTLWMCVSYGGRAEIAEAARSAARHGEVTEETIGRNLWSAEMPDCDLIIRTSGQKRLSGFLTWKSVYAELFFLDTLWPDFDEQMLDSVLVEYAKRERRFGR
ncbi:MAG TPA: polyprenyl diphosphate synthase [Candidatus Paceibacterota bacterium]